MKNLTTYLFTFLVISTHPLKASEDQEDLKPHDLLTTFVSTQDIRHLISFNNAVEGEGSRLKTPFPEDLIARATVAMLEPLALEVNLDQVATYPTMRPTLRAVILFCARLLPKLQQDQVQKLIGACELYRTVELNKLTGLGLFDPETVTMSEALDLIQRTYSKSIPSKLLADYAEYDPISRFSVQVGYFLSNQVCFYRKRPRIAIASYLAVIGALFAIKRYVSSRR